VTLALHDDLYDAQFVRTLAYTAQGGAEIGECFATAKRITKTDGELWYREWLATAQRAHRAAEESAAAGHLVSARGAYFRASNYYRTAGIFLMGAPVDDRFRATSHLQTETFRKGAALLDLPPDVLEIPYEQTSLPGYFFRASDDGAARPTIILTNGYDGTVEEMYFANAVAALERGYNVLAFDGPGQGSVILDQGIVFRPDWENVVTPVVDFALTLSEVDPARLVLHGWSFGGYTAPRAASGEQRLAACIADSGPFDLNDALMARVPGALARQLPDGNRVARKILDEALESTMKKPSAGWAMRRNLWVHGLTDPMEFFTIAPQYSLKGRAQLIECPTFVCTTEGDDIGAAASTLAENLVCTKEFVRFGADDDVTGHCEMSGRAVFHRRVFDWLDGVLAPDSATTGSGAGHLAVSGG
jgi:pimeloyl-ACP methyl ester carboxylesterase